jgi:outer membrane protein TolC
LAGEQVKLERSDFLPQVALAGSYSYLHGFEVNDKNLFYKPGYGVALSVSVPLFHFGEGMNKVRAARKEQERIAAQREDLVEQMNLALVQAANNLDEAFLEVSLTDKLLSEAEENLRTSGREYELGLETLTDYMEAQTLWQQAVADKVDARCRLFLAGTKYRKAAGTLRR